MNKSILDMCCGSRMFWFDRAKPLKAKNHLTG